MAFSAAQLPERDLLAHPSERDDRVLPATHTAALVVFLILVPAVIVLWGMPSHTADRWAWTIKPPLTAIFLGSGYGAGAYFFWRTYRAERWHPSSAGVLGASVFAALMLLATLLHWDTFNHGHAPFLGAFAFWGWTIVYIISPPAVFALWRRNRATDSGRRLRGDPVMSAAVLGAARVCGLLALVTAAVFYISPATAMHVWSWKLTPLTARVVASFIAQVGVGAMVLSFERRWSGWQLIIQTFFVATTLLLVGAARESGDFGPSGLRTALYVGGLVAADAALLVLYARMEWAISRRPGRRSSHRRRPAVPPVRR
jgi:peptidoglycan/LPS O-acetylase OafA/YrhL